MVEIEVQLAKALGWSLFEIDETDASHLMALVNHLTKGPQTAGGRMLYADDPQAAWL